jgi:NAD(P)-dependent dehydrogenase (short-subunit alcohol dehydrogenase family)
MTDAAFADRVAVVTGGASGIGAAVVALLTAAGATVEVADLDAESPTDVTDSQAVGAFASDVLGRHGRCDVLVNCAGALAAGTALEVTERDWDKAFDTNVRAPWLMSRAFLASMPSGSVIVNVASGAGLRAIPNMAAYVASKTALVGLTRAMALDHADAGIRVNCVCPGVIDTPMNDQAQRDRPAEVRESVAGFNGYLVKRYGTADEVADAVLYLASPRAAYITGATLAVDGGRTMH